MAYKFKGFIAVVIILLLTQQNFAAHMPMKCDGMKTPTILNQDKDPQLTINMTMHDHDSPSNDPLSNDIASSHDECDVCNSGDCKCAKMGSYFGSTITTSAQGIDQSFILFVDYGNRLISQDEYPDAGFYLHPFRPPIYIQS
jgi:hypothetical protein